MCEVLRALVKCGGLFFMSTNFIRPLIWEVTRLGTANTKVWYFLCHALVSFVPRLVRQILKCGIFCITP